MSDNQTTDEGDNQTTEPVSFLQSLNEELRSEPALSKFTDKNALAKSYVNAERLIGRDKIPMPQSDEEYRETYQRLGMPEAEDKYEIADVEWEDGFKKPDIDNKLRSFAFENNLSQSQAEAANKWFYENLLGMAKSNKTGQQAMAEESMKNAQNDWGDAFKGNIELAKRVINEYGDDSTKEFFEKSGLGNNINLLRVFSKIGNKLVEDRVLEGSTPSGFSPTEIETQIKELQAKPAYLDKRNPDHKALLGQVQNLYKKLYPEAA